MCIVAVLAAMFLSPPDQCGLFSDSPANHRVNHRSSARYFGKIMSVNLPG
jgi:hypothetical protein